MAAHEDGGFVLFVIVAEEAADGALSVDIEAEGGFVEEEDLGLVHECGEEFGFHALPE